MTRRTKRSRRHRNIDTLRSTIQCEYQMPAQTDTDNLLLYHVPRPDFPPTISSTKNTQIHLRLAEY
ncbi:MAG: hypothetical protein RMY34_16445 [Aulosira sp. DedQUE10]|nr:hypothetical protein [Aulosira sp. DedQUE10]